MNTYSEKIRDRLIELIRHTEALKKLDLANNILIPPCDIVTICQVKRAVKSLQLANCSQLDNACVREILLNLARLKKLTVSGCPNVSDKAIPLLDVPYLQTGCKPQVVVENLSVESQDREMVFAFGIYLRSLFIGAIVSVCENTLWIKLDASSASLDVYNALIIPEWLHPLLSKYPVSLKISYSAIISDPITNLYAKFLQEISPFVQELHLSPGMRNEVKTSTIHFSLLEHLHIDSRLMHEEDFAHLSCPNLTTFSIAGSSVIPMEFIRRLSFLEELDCTGQEIDSYKQLAAILLACPSLKHSFFSLPKTSHEVATLSQKEIQVLLVPIAASNTGQKVLEMLLDRLIIDENNFLDMLQAASRHKIAGLHMLCQQWLYFECYPHVKIHCQDDVVVVDFQFVTKLPSAESSDGKKLHVLLSRLHQCQRLDVVFRYDGPYASNGIADVLSKLSNLHRLTFIQKPDGKNTPESVYSGVFKGDAVQILELEGFELSVSACNAIAKRYPAISELSLTRGSKSSCKALTSSHLASFSLQKIGFLHSQDLCHDDLESIIESFSQLTSLSVTECKLVTDKTIHMLSDKLLKLEELVVDGCSITDEALFQMPKLKRLSIARTQVTDKGLNHLGICNPELISLNVSGNSVSAGSFETVNQLQSLELADCKAVDMAVLDSVATHCSDLRMLNIRNCPQVTDEVLYRLLTKCQQLSAIDVAETCVHPRIQMQCVSIDSGVETVQLDMNESYSEWAVALLCEMYPHAKTVQLANCEGVQRERMEQILQCIKNHDMQEVLLD